MRAKGANHLVADKRQNVTELLALQERIASVAVTDGLAEYDRTNCQRVLV